MKRSCLFILAPSVAALLGACAPDITENQPTPGPRAIFDDTTGTIPLPSDLLKGPNGNLNLPVLPSDSELTRQVKTALNDIDGWLTGSTITLPFDTPLDPSTVTPETVLLADLGPSHEAPIASVFVDDRTQQPVPYFTLFNVGLEPAKESPYNIIVKLKFPAFQPIEFKQGHRYAVVVTDAVKGMDGLPAISHPAFDLLKSSTPLVDENGHSRVIVPDDQAALLELGRSGVIAPVFDALEAKGMVSREHAVSYAVFSTQSGARPGFNPLTFGKVLPAPIDTVTDGAITPGHAATTDPINVCFDLPYDPATTDGNVLMFTYREGAPLAPIAVHVTATTAVPESDDRCTKQKMFPLTVVPDASLQPGMRYLVALTKGIKTAAAQQVPAQPSVYFTLARATTPILDTTTDPATLNSPFVDLTLDVLILTTGKDPATATHDDWVAAYQALVSNLRTIESWRTAYSPLFDAVEAAGTPRSDVIVLWSFTTAAQ